MKACNLRNGRALSTNVAVAYRLFDRMKGLLGKRQLESGESLLIRPCKSVHTMGMRFPIDIIFLDKNNRIIALSKHLLPNRLSLHHFKAVSVLELPAGTLTATETIIGDSIEIA